MQARRAAAPLPRPASRRARRPLLRHLRAARRPGRRAASTSTALRAAVLGVASAARPAVGRTGLDQILRGLDRMRARYGDVPGFGSAAGHGRSAVLSAIDARGRRRRARLERRRAARAAAARARRVRAAAPASRPLRSTPIWPRACATGGSSARAATACPPTSWPRTRASTRSAAGCPATRSELAEVPGMGPARVERYGGDLLELVRAGAGAGPSRPPLPV